MNGNRRTLIVGIGSDFGDDRLGPFVADRLSTQLLSVDVCCLRSPIHLLDHLAGVGRLHIVDACRGAGPTGTIVRCDWPLADLSAVRFSGTHDFGLLAALQLADRLQLLPPHVTIWSAEAADSEAQQADLSPLSPAVAAAAEAIMALLAAEVCTPHEVFQEPIRHA